MSNSKLSYHGNTKQNGGKKKKTQTKTVTSFIPNLTYNFKILNLSRCQKPSADSNLVIT